MMIQSLKNYDSSLLFVMMKKLVVKLLIAAVQSCLLRNSGQHILSPVSLVKNQKLFPTIILLYTYIIISRLFITGMIIASY